LSTIIMENTKYSICFSAIFFQILAREVCSVKLIITVKLPEWQSFRPQILCA
jgi:hypothetical protein